MALTDSLPTSDPGGLTVVDERLILAGLLAKNADGTPRVGVFPAGTAALVQGRASMGYDVLPFKAAASRTGAGIELVANDALTTVTTTAAPGANSRIDVIWWRPQFTANADPGNVPIFGVTQGTAAPIPSKPSIPAGALELATAEILSSTTTTAAVVITQAAPWTAMAGGIVPVRNPTELAAWSAADMSTARVVSTGEIYRRVSGAWVLDRIDSGWLPVTFQNGWSNAISSESVEIRKINGVVYTKGRPTGGTGTTVFTYPVGYRPKHMMRLAVKNGGSAATSYVDVNPDGTVVTPTGAQPVLSGITPFPADG